MERALHPALLPEPGAPTVTRNTLLDEYDAAAVYATYWQESREQRAMMVAAVKIREALKAMFAYDTAPSERA